MSSNPPPLRVVDVSNNNAQPIDWKAVARAGISGAIIKRSEGSWFVDPDFAVHWAGARAAGLVVGAYHFAAPANHPQADAASFLALLPPLQPGDLIALDIETGSGDQSAWALSWLQTVEAALGFKPLLYSYQAYIQTSLTDPRLARYPLWLAAYTWLPASMPPWPEVAIWQHTDQAIVPGIPGRVDESLIARDLAGLRALGKPAPTWRIAVACGLKEQPNHICQALAQLPTGMVVQTLGQPVRTDDLWQQIVTGMQTGYVPVSKLQKP